MMIEDINTDVELNENDTIVTLKNAIIIQRHYKDARYQELVRIINTMLLIFLPRTLNQMHTTIS